MISIVLALLAAAANAASSVLQRTANVRELQSHRTGLRGIAHLLRQPLWLAGIGAVIVSFLLQAGALAVGELAEVQPLLSLELPLTLLIASVVFHRRLDRATWLDIAAMTLGMAVFLFSLFPTDGDPSRPDGLAWALGAGVTGALVGALAVLGLLSSGTRRAASFGVASGVAFALTATFMAAAASVGSVTALFGHWQTYLVVVAGLVAMLLLQAGLQSGTLVAVQPGVTLSDPVIAVVLGTTLFAESVRTGPWLAPELLGAAAVGWGAVRLSRSPVADPDQDSPEEAGTGEEPAPEDRSPFPAGPGG